MGLGDMMGKAAGALGGSDDILGKLGEMGVNPAEMAGMDADGIKGLLEAKGIDLSMLEGMGLSLDDLVAKLSGGA